MEASELHYQELKYIYYQNSSEYHEEYQKRFAGLGSLQLPLFIKPYKDNESENQLFVVNIPKITFLTETILQKINKLPHFTGAYKVFFIHKLFVEELVATNEIEGIHSSRKEINAALTNTSEKSARFKFLVRKYHTLMGKEQKELMLQTPQNLRTIYEELLTGEITENNRIDGQFFRSGGVEVTSGSGKGIKPIHTGIDGEKQIISHVEQLINFYQKEDVSFFLKLAVIHYYLGYIHPFYDGNGRLARFISSAMLSEVNPLVALKLSTTIKKNRTAYYDAFKSVNNPYNQGDVTPFYLFFLDILNQATDDLLQQQKEIMFKRKKAKEFIIEKIGKNVQVKSCYFDTFFIIFQAFILENQITIKILAKNLKVSSSTARKYVNQLQDLGLVIKEKNNICLAQAVESAFEDYLKKDFETSAKEKKK